MEEIDKGQVVDLLNRILEQELAGVIRYTHYSFLVFGFGRLPTAPLAARLGARVALSTAASSTASGWCRSRGLMAAG